MFNGRRCECDECMRHRRRRREVKEVKEVREVPTMRPTVLDGLREGDKIRVFSGGDQIDGVGVFIRVEDGFLIWVDHHADINITSLNVISVQRIC
ncbi:hypothetical protein CON65_12810 [Bacillus pseudomycoides]|uniref:Uncharacterized protein n=1 Tax=Bacillus pseudomycoides TaxID=64104 RepID=A0AA91ZT22_9BACI|nr:MULTISPECIES: hypothetical protein [Bacillus]PEB52168.1 hypothetical protein COO03_13155 [Bacillus sp. AFS098217]PED82300.1 hypothetical protein CON65_12810 [Bacillus pseudomycoides]PEU06321.1 hypothetical protein CN524_23930 [Bacillus sp. AFS019443]PEU10124.1 hypothetical protein CN525_23985 [Bacillus sp. AFS014408]PFW61912.1 hypothetical protein COL20_15380 [Bacillus sp. AFS075034]